MPTPIPVPKRASTAVAIALSVLFAAASTATDGSPPRAIESSVVQIIAHSNPADLLTPWQRAGADLSTGSGVILEGNRILTAAHVVEGAVSIEVKRTGMGDRFVATAAFVGDDCDLALLTVEDPRVFDGVEPLRLGDMPAVQDPVKAYGFPVGGETISVTSGILSRVEVSTYAHSFEDLLLAQIDAPLNPGNSGGPVVADGALVGIAVQSLAEGESIGYMIPVPIIRHFLDDLEDGRYDGLPNLGLALQALESGALRASLDMRPEATGVLVNRVDFGSPAYPIARPGDVLTAIDGLPIANDGTVAIDGIGRVALFAVAHSKQVGEPLAIALLRDGKKIDGTLTLDAHRALVPGRRLASGPEYLVFGGLVFQPLTINYLRYFEELPFDLADLAFFRNVVTAERRQVLLIQKVLPHAVNRGYQEWEDYVVTTVDGAVPRDMAHLAQLLDDGDGRWLTIETDDGSRLVIDRAAARAAHREILERFGIAHDRSQDLRKGGR